MHTTDYAVITDLTLADDGVFLVKATCQRCTKTVLHGAGRDPGRLVLGDRRSHCCEGSYELVDVDNTIPRRLIAIAAEVDAKASRRAAARARRVAADND